MSAAAAIRTARRRDRMASVGGAVREVPVSDPVDPWGVQLVHHDVDGTRHTTSEGALRAIHAAMAAPEAPPPDVWSVWTVGAGQAPELMGPVDVELEDGSVRHAVDRLPDDLPIGYHTLHHVWEDGRGDRVRLIVAPRQCAAPPPSRTWGLSTQLYAARSRDSWGVGDLADLRHLGSWLRGLGGAALLVNPLDAPTPSSPMDPCPYFPSSRLFLDPAYLRIDELPGAHAADLSDLRAQGRRDNVAPTLQREATHRRAVAACERIFDAVPTAGHEPAFRAFWDEHDPELTDFATYCALAEVHGGPWRQWPPAHRHPAGDAVRAFRSEHAERVRFHAWMQWLLDDQLAAAGRAVPLLRDLPVGFDPDGADAWMWQDLLADDVTVGAPPDPLGPRGQDWRLPPFVPWKLRAAGYRPIVRTLRAAFRHAAGLRIDHVLGLFRLFWIPTGGTPADGAYVRYAERELLDVLALESQRAGAWVVGEDLGTVADGVREEMAARQMLRYQVLWFEGAPPGQWAELALASVTTHDLATIAGVWTGNDLEDQRSLGLQPDESFRARVVERLVEQAGVSPDAPVGEVVEAAHRLLSGAAARVVVGQLEDVAGLERRENVPGTTMRQRPENWSMPLPARLDDLFADPEVRRRVTALGAHR